MIIVRAGSVCGEERSGGLFIGNVKVATLMDESKGSKEYIAAMVTFPPGSRTKIHVHDHEQILFVVKGRGFVGTESEEREIREGDLILIPAGERHWHGAGPDSEFAHLTIIRSGTKTTW